MISYKIDSFLKNNRSTLLGVGPMSQNCVDATIELANETGIPMFLIASRRQIECAELGGGYVENWTTEKFSSYVKTKDKKGRIILARDHGGPWQNTKEVENKLSLRNAMESAKLSYKVDIMSGLEKIHIDPSIDIFGVPDQQEVLERVFELYEFCWSLARQQGREIIFEIGTEEQSGEGGSLEHLDWVLGETQKYLTREKLPLPKFVVVQTGTRTLEMRNVGTFDSPFRVRGELPAEIQIPRLLALCRRYNIFMKEHNCDYLSDESLAWHPRFGIHAANVAPEFGVAESKAIVSLLCSKNLTGLADRFLELSYLSGKWKKWMAPDTKASDRDRALISGHYVFATSQFLELRDVACKDAKISLDEFQSYLRLAVKQSIARYLRLFNPGRNHA